MSEVSPDNETQKQEKETGSEGKISLIYSRCAGQYWLFDSEDLRLYCLTLLIHITGNLTSVENQWSTW